MPAPLFVKAVSNLKFILYPGYRMVCRVLQKSLHIWSDISAGLFSEQDTHKLGGWLWALMDTRGRAHGVLDIRWVPLRPAPFCFAPQKSCWFYLLSNSFLFISSPILFLSPPELSLCIPYCHYPVNPDHFTCSTLLHIHLWPPIALRIKAKIHNMAQALRSGPIKLSNLVWHPPP